MTTQSTGSPKRRLAGILIALIALPVLALAPAFLADRFATQSPSTDGQATIQPSASDISDKSVDNVAATTNETTVPVDDAQPMELDDEGFVIYVDSEEFEPSLDIESLEFLLTSDIIRVTTTDESNADDPLERIVIIDSRLDDECEFTLHFDSGAWNNETFTGYVKIDEREMDLGCARFFGSEPNAQ